MLTLPNSIVVSHDHREVIAQRLGLLEVVQVACVKQVKDANSENTLHTTTKYGLG